MTDAEKKRMLQLVRITEFMFSQSLALKLVLLSHGVPEKVWERELSAALNDPETRLLWKPTFQRLYDEIEQAVDEKAAVEALLRALPEAKKPSN
jgi:hypothetical protein